MRPASPLAESRRTRAISRCRNASVELIRGGREIDLQLTVAYGLPVAEVAASLGGPDVAIAVRAESDPVPLP